jgi:hypothetical protein
MAPKLDRNQRLVADRGDARVSSLRVLQPTRRLGHYRYIRFGIDEATALRLGAVKEQVEDKGFVLDVEALLRQRLGELIAEAEADLRDLAHGASSGPATAALGGAEQEDGDAGPAAEA